MPGLIDTPGTHTMRATIPAEGTAGTADNWIIGTVPANATVTGVKWIPGAAVTGANTNNFALAVVNKQTGAGAVTVTTAKTYASGTNSAASTPEALTLSSTATDLQPAAGDVLAFARTVNGSGLASPAGQVEVSFLIR